MLHQELSIFEYFYRDASNYKVWGTLLLEGVANETDLQVLTSKFESCEFFIAEQLAIPALYEELWKFSNGPTNEDHVWHTFYALRAVTPDDTTTEIFSSVADLVEKIKFVKKWNTELSPNCEI